MNDTSTCCRPSPMRWDSSDQRSTMPYSKEHRYGSAVVDPGFLGGANYKGGGGNLLFRPFLPAATKLGQGNVFTGVCLSTGGSASVHAGMPDPPGPGTPPPGSRPPPGADPPPRSRPSSGPGTPPPPRESDARIWSMSGQYASYWNAFLFSLNLHENENVWTGDPPKGQSGKAGSR